MTVLYFQPNDCPAGLLKLAGAHRRARERGISLQRVEASLNPTRVRKLIDFWQPDGCIVESGDDTSYPSTVLFDGVPTVFIDRDTDTLPDGVRAVNLDSTAVGRLAARELLRLGFDDYAFVPARKDVSWSRERGRAFADAVELNEKSVAVFDRTRRKASDAEALSRFLSGLRRPTGVFAADDTRGALVLSVAARLGLEVPRDIAVVSVDDDRAICDNTRPTLSSIAPDFRSAGALAVDLLLAKKPAKRRFGVLGFTRRTSSFVPAANLPGVGAALDLIRTEATAGLSAASVVAVLGVSRRLAERRFRQVTGQTILGAIHARRMEKAFELLSTTGTSLSGLADLTGWKSPSAFRAHFHKVTGMSPRKWKARHADALSGSRRNTSGHGCRRCSA